MGDLVKIKVVAANLSKKQLDYEWVPLKKGISNLSAVTGGELGGRIKSSNQLTGRQKDKHGLKASTKRKNKSPGHFMHSV